MGILSAISKTLRSNLQKYDDHHRDRLRHQIEEADIERGKGVMASLSRGSVLVSQEKVFLGRMLR